MHWWFILTINAARVLRRLCNQRFRSFEYLSQILIIILDIIDKENHTFEYDKFSHSGSHLKIFERFLKDSQIVWLGYTLMYGCWAWPRLSTVTLCWSGGGIFFTGIRLNFKPDLSPVKFVISSRYPSHYVPCTNIWNLPPSHPTTSTSAFPVCLALEWS